MHNALRKPPVSVFSAERGIQAPKLAKTQLAKGLKYNQRLNMDGLQFLAKLAGDSIPVAFFDSQHRGAPDKLRDRRPARARGTSPARSTESAQPGIAQFVRGIDKALMPSGHLFLWVDKWHLCRGFRHWLEHTALEVVDLVTWNKDSQDTRRASEHLLVLQKSPRRAKGVWQVHNIPDVWGEAVESAGHPQPKPIALQRKLIEAVSNVGDVVIDPAAGSYSTMASCRACGRNFLGCDIDG